MKNRIDTSLVYLGNFLTFLSVIISFSTENLPLTVTVLCLMGNITSNLSGLLRFHRPTQMGGPWALQPAACSHQPVLCSLGVITVMFYYSQLRSQISVKFEMVVVLGQSKRPVLRQLLGSQASSLVVFHGGAGIGWTSSALPPGIRDQDTAAMVGALFCLATCLGNILAPLLTRRLGQKRSLVVVGLPLLCAHWVLVTSYRLGNNLTLSLTKHLTLFVLSSKLHLDHSPGQSWGRSWLRTVAVPGSLLYPRYLQSQVPGYIWTGHAPHGQLWYFADLRPRLHV